MNILGVVPLRSGSKRIVHKNFQMVCKQPLYWWIVEAAVQTNIFNRIVLSTDEKGKRLIEELNPFWVNYPKPQIEILVRPEELARDDSPSESVLTHAIKTLCKEPPSVIVLLQATSPLVLPRQIKDAVKAVLSGYNSAVLLTETREHFWHKQNGQWCPMFISNPRAHPIYFREVGVYAVKGEEFLESGDLTAPPTQGVVIPHECALDIDEWNDMKLADLVLRERHEKYDPITQYEKV